MRPKRVLVLFGTRPEAIKLCPVIRDLQSRPDDFDVRVCVTGQHREMLDSVLSVFEVEPNYDLNTMEAAQSLTASTARILAGLERIMLDFHPELVIVQGDTTSTFCGALASFYQRVPVAHVEAGLRTFDLWQPFPEEMNRVVTTRLSALHFAATERGRNNLLAEGVPEKYIHITGNTGIDALLFVRDQILNGDLIPFRSFEAPAGRRIVLVTMHRRESFGDGQLKVCRALRKIAARDDVHMILPVHPNPAVEAVVKENLSEEPNIQLIEPLDYVSFVDLLRTCHFVITDSGGVQEEGPSLGKPILVLRDKTERPEAIDAGTVQLVGTDEKRIVRQCMRLLDSPSEYVRRSFVHNPYGDGQASPRISSAIHSFLKT
ncbi:MAG: UDP-N-acetylglucosamine 2-epimerase (non-hydrolyzing) [Bryobacteraceae bacterium]|nr:UDP-N-acetylglucosamine 2-epimerase (non-hydrolyzing) [Bryobacteraceae bacterium]